MRLERTGVVEGASSTSRQVKKKQSRAKVKPKKESDIVREILEGLSTMKIGSFDRINNNPIFDPTRKIFRAQSKFTPKGISDIIGVYKGKYVAIECKSERVYKMIKSFYSRIKYQVGTYQPKNKFEEHVLNQIRFIEGKIREGGVGFFTYSLEDTIIKLKEGDLKNDI